MNENISDSNINIENEKKPDLVRFLEKVEWQIWKKISEILENTEMSYIDFQDLLLRMNGIIRGVKEKDRKISNTVNITSNNDVLGKEITYIPPKNKDIYLEKMYHIFMDNNIDIETKARIIYYGIQYIHPFWDGNWRTGRALYQLIKTNYDIKNDDLWQVLQNTKWRIFLDIPDAEEIQRIVEYNVIGEYLRKQWIEDASRIYSQLQSDSLAINEK